MKTHLDLLKSYSAIQESDFSAKQRELYDTMSDISEDLYFAGWISGNEYMIWDALTGKPPKNATLPQDLLEEVRLLSEELDGWIIWLDDSLLPELPVELWGAVFLPKNWWLKMVDNEFSLPTIS